MIFTGQMCLISGWNFVTRYGVCSQKFSFLFISLFVHLFSTKILISLDSDTSQETFKSITWQKKKKTLIYIFKNLKVRKGAKKVNTCFSQHEYFPCPCLKLTQLNFKNIWNDHVYIFCYRSGERRCNRFTLAKPVFRNTLRLSKLGDCVFLYLNYTSFWKVQINKLTSLVREMFCRYISPSLELSSCLIFVSNQGGVSCRSPLC